VPQIAELLREKRTLSLEFSAPADDYAAQQTRKALHKLEVVQPDFASVTYGAGGSTRDATRELVEVIHHETAIPVMPHLTCVGHTRQQIDDILRGYVDLGIENLLCLGGDAPADGSAPPSDFRYATELIEVARATGSFSIGVAAFPEVHPRSPDRETDRRFLAAKLRMADFAITQFGFTADVHFKMIDELDALGVETPIIPGVMLFRTVDGVRRMSRLNNATIPTELEHQLDLVDGDPTAVRKLAVEWGTRLTADLLERGVPGVHFYTLGASRATLDVYANLGLGPMTPGSS
jgi:methylenetetrahydrofolate reductase (NADPH)